jgi:hypothetical protein
MDNKREILLTIEESKYQELLCIACSKSVEETKWNSVQEVIRIAIDNYLIKNNRYDNMTVKIGRVGK